MLNIGCHLSTSKGFKNMGKEALSIGANTFQYFTRNPRGGKAKDIDEKDILALRKLMEENKFAKIFTNKSLQFPSRKSCKARRRCRNKLYS